MCPSSARLNVSQLGETKCVPIRPLLNIAKQTNHRQCGVSEEFGEGGDTKWPISLLSGRMLQSLLLSALIITSWDCSDLLGVEVSRSDGDLIVELSNDGSTKIPKWVPCTLNATLSKDHRNKFFTCDFSAQSMRKRSIIRSVRWLVGRQARFYSTSEHQLFSRALEMPVFNDPLFSRQWYLWNRIKEGHDLNVAPIWAQGFTGKGVTIALIDDGVDFEHVDLRDSFRKDLSYDFNKGAGIPRPHKSRGDFHGTRCAGQIVAKPNNGICGVGIAPGAQISALRILSGVISNTLEAAAVAYENQKHDIYTCSWGPADDGKFIDSPSKLVLRAFTEGLVHGRSGRGSIYVFAAGNGKAVDNCNYDGYANGIFALTVGAIDVDHQMPPYMEPCSAQLVTAYSSNDQFRISTTELGSNRCTSKHGGTSAAAPMVTGVLALVLEARPDLGWRDVRHILVESAVRISTDDYSWTQNGAGKWYSYKFGFGKVDGLRVFETARQWKAIAPPIFCSLPTKKVGRSIDRRHPVVVDELLIDERVIVESELCHLGSVEQVTVRLNIEHSRRGDLIIKLTSPAGTTITLASRRPLDESAAGLHDWTMMTVGFWGESVGGRWRLQVGNAGHGRSENVGTLVDYRLAFLGSTTGVYDAERFTTSVIDSYYPPTEEFFNDQRGFWGDSKDPLPTVPNPVGEGSRRWAVRRVSPLLAICSLILIGYSAIYWILQRHRRARLASYSLMDGNSSILTESYSLY